MQIKLKNNQKRYNLIKIFPSEKCSRGNYANDVVRSKYF